MNGRNLQARDGSILVVCTGNVCRSPYIERLLRSRLVETNISVSSAGTAALVGSDMDPHVARRLTYLGGDSTEFEARQLTAGMVNAADLILCATRQHRSQVVRMTPRALRRTYALPDFSDLAVHLVGAAIPLRAEPDNFIACVSASAEKARSSVQARTNEEAAIIDPFRQSEKVFERMFDGVEQMLPPIIAVLTGSSPDRISLSEASPAK